MIAIEMAKPDRSTMINFIGPCECLPGGECRGIFSWALGLRLADPVQQLPRAIKVLEAMVRPWPRFADNV